MSDTKELLERARARFTPPEDVMESLIRRRARKNRNRRLAAAALALGLALATFAGLMQILRTTARPADEPTPSPSGKDIFADVHGWIVYGTESGIWAVNPNGTGSIVQLSDHGGDPVAWSSDGSKLLISDGSKLLNSSFFVLNADGSEMTVRGATGLTNPSFSPDGSQVVYEGHHVQGWPRRIYVVDLEGGTPRLLRSGGRQWYSYDQAFFRTLMFRPTFSPDGTKIAYVEGMGDWGNGLRVMNADGTHVRVLIDSDGPFAGIGWIEDLGWSADGSYLAFTGPGGIWTIGADGSDLTNVAPHGSYPRWAPTDSRLVFQAQGAIWVIGADGSGLTKVMPGATRPRWSADGSLISAEAGPVLKVIREDGTILRQILNAGSGPWNPLPLSAHRDRERTATAEGSGVPFVYTIVPLGILGGLGVLVLVRRARRKNPMKQKRDRFRAVDG